MPPAPPAPTPAPVPAPVPAALLAAMPAVFVLLWSTGFIGAKLGLPYAEPLTFLALRFALLVGLLGAVALLTRAPWPRSWAMAGHIAVSGLLVHAVYLGGVFAAIAHGLPAGVASLVVGLQPLVTAVVVGPLLGERVSARQWVGLLLGLGGVVLVVGERALAGLGGTGVSGGAGLDPLALGLAVLALGGITFGTVYQKRTCAAMDLRTGTCIQYLAAGLACGTVALALESMHITWSGEFLFALAWLVLVLSVGAISLLTVMIRRGAVARVASFFYMVPPVTAVIAWALFDETLGPAALAGFVVSAAGVALVAAPARRA